MSLAKLERAVTPGQAILLDTSALSAYFGNEITSPVASAVIDRFIYTGRNRGVVSAVTAAELLVWPLRGGRPDVGASMTRFLQLFPHVELASVDLSVARTAAALRVRDGMKLPDALIAATGLDRSAALAISDDAGWPELLAHGDATMRIVELRSFLPFD